MGLNRSTCNYTQHPEEGDSSLVLKKGNIEKENNKNY